jgi:hypothetical protein
MLPEWDFTIVISGIEGGVSEIESEAQSFATFSSPPLATQALFVIVPGAPAAIVAVTVIGFPDAPLAITVPGVEVHDGAFAGTRLHVQFVPDIPVTVRPAGTLSVTV